jgi:hypothetical protein
MTDMAAEIENKTKKSLFKAQWRCTAKQKRKILKLWGMCMREQTEEALTAFVRRTTGIQNLLWLDVAGASKVITALNRIYKKGAADGTLSWNDFNF